MFAFGHVGLTWGGVLAAARVSRWLTRSGSSLGGGATRRPALRPRASTPIDYRFVILGSMLPDLIDKPLGVFIFRKELSNGRIFAHGLLPNTAVLLAALTWRRRADRHLVSLALGTAAHLALDRMWMDPKTLLWPLGGWRPERRDVSDWVKRMLKQLISDPHVYVPEAVGALVFGAFTRSLLNRRGLREFARTGRMAGWSREAPSAGLADWEESPQQFK